MGGYFRDMDFSFSKPSDWLRRSENKGGDIFEGVVFSTEL